MECIESDVAPLPMMEAYHAFDVGRDDVVARKISSNGFGQTERWRPARSLSEFISSQDVEHEGSKQDVVLVESLTFTMLVIASRNYNVPRRRQDDINKTKTHR